MLKDDENQKLIDKINELYTEKNGDNNVNDLIALKNDVNQMEIEFRDILNESQKLESENMIKEALIEKLKETIIDLNLQLQQKKSD